MYDEDIQRGVPDCFQHLLEPRTAAYVLAGLALAAINIHEGHAVSLGMLPDSILLVVQRIPALDLHCRRYADITERLLFLILCHSLSLNNSMQNYLRANGVQNRYSSHAFAASASQIFLYSLLPSESAPIIRSTVVREALLISESFSSIASFSGT